MFATFYNLISFIYFFLVIESCYILICIYIQFKVDRLQIIVVAKNITVLQLFISRMPKMCAIPQLVSAPLNPIPTVEHFRRSHPQCVHSEDNSYMSVYLF